MLRRIRKALSWRATSAPRPFDPERSDTPEDPNEIFSVRIFNDDSTPVEFVISLAEKHLNLSKYEAAQLALRVHRAESYAFGRMSCQTAQSIVTAMREEIEAEGMSLKIESEHWMTGQTT